MVGGADRQQKQCLRDVRYKERSRRVTGQYTIQPVMATGCKVLFLLVILGALAPSLARVFLFDDGQPEFGGGQGRSRQQPLVEYVFQQNNDPIQERELNHGESRTARQSSRWDLGYDAGNILNPPGLETAETRYRTLNIYKRPVSEAPIVWGTLKQGAVINRPQRSSMEANLGEVLTSQRSARKKQSEEEQEEEDEENDEEEQEEEKTSEAGYAQEGHSYHQVPASIYTFVKTDPHGNFKWGVRRGPPVRG